MKKKLFLTALLAMMMAVLSACGGTNPDKYVTLPNYEQLSTEVTYVTFTEDELQDYIDNELETYVQVYDLYDYQTIAGANTVSNNSIVNIDYQGKIDGEIFEGGTAQGAHLEIGSGSFIDGFEDGLIGVNVGENVELNLAFPETYYNTEYAGKDVVFSVSVNSIDERKMPEYSDEFITSLGISADITTYDAYKEAVREYLQETCDSQNEYALQTAVWNTVYAACEVSDPPQEMIDTQYAFLKSDIQTYAEAYGMDVESLVAAQGMDMESFEAELMTSATENAKSELVCMAIAKAEGIKIDEDAINEVAESEYAMYNYESAQELIEANGQDYFESYVLRKKVLERLAEVITITENEPVSLLGAQ